MLGTTNVRKVGKYRYDIYAKNTVVKGKIGNTTCILVPPTLDIDLIDYKSEIINLNKDDEFSLSDYYKDEKELYKSGFRWIACSNLNTPRNLLDGSGNPSSALAFGGNISVSYFGDIVNTVEMYNGYIWENIQYMNIGRAELTGTGSTNSTVAIGGVDNDGNIVTTFEIFNGNIWSSDTDYPELLFSMSSSGTSRAMLAFGGTDLNYNSSDKCYKYIGTMKTETTMNTSRHCFGGCGTTEATLAVGGVSNDSHLISTEQFNGSSWIVGPNITNSGACSAYGNSNSALAFGFSGSNSKITEKFNGSFWSTEAVDIENEYSLNYLGAGCAINNTEALSFGTSGTFKYLYESYNYSIIGNLISDKPVIIK